MHIKRSITKRFGVSSPKVRASVDDADPRIRALRDEGDKARDERRWETAISAYKEYLDTFSEDFDIWVQLGHAYKESGNFARAESAYRSALNINKENADLLLSFGHLSKLQGKLATAVDFYRKSFDIEPNKDAAYELYSLGEDTGKPMAVAGERVANGSRLGISASALFEAWPADETNGSSNVVARAPQAFLHFRGLPSNLFEIRPDTGHVANLILAAVSSDEDWESLDLLTRDLQLDNFNILVLCSAVDSYVKLQGDLSRCLKFIMIEVDHPRRYAQVFLSLLN